MMSNAASDKVTDQPVAAPNPLSDPPPGRSPQWWQRFTRRRRDWGLRRALYWYLMTPLARLGLRINYVFAASPLANQEYIALPDGYVNRAVSLEELAPFVDKVDGLDAEFYALAQAHDDWCVASFFHDQLVGYSFLTHSRTRASGQLDIIVPNGFSYSYKSWTDPAHRLARLSSSRLYHSAVAFPDSKRAFYYVETHNYASLLRSYRPLSQRRIHMGYIGWFTWFGRQIPFASRRALWLGVEFVPRGQTRERFYA